MTAVDGFRSALSLLSLLSLLSSGSGISCVLTLMAFGVCADLVEPRIPVGMGIFELVGGGKVRRERD